VHGVIQGESRPKEFIPKRIDLLMQDRMPMDRMITFYDLADINRAAADSVSGATIKPVLQMNR
jgi:aryl-alcohol dehydrogenase